MSATAAAPEHPVGSLPPPGHYGFAGLCRAEWTKLRTVRSTMWTFGVIVILGIGLSALVTSLTRSHWNSMNFIQRATFDPVSASLSGIGLAQFAIGVLGVLSIGAEYGTGTIRATLSAAPRRIWLLIAKASVFAVVALVVSEIVTFISFFLGQSLLGAPAFHVTIGSPGALRAVVGGGAYLCLLGLIALGLGAIIRNSAGAISAFVIILLVVPILTLFLPDSLQQDIQRFFPANIGRSITSPLHSDAHSFGPGAGLLVLGLYAAVALVIGGMLLVRRDA